MHNNQSSYNRWSWIVALILALILLWMLMAGRGPSSACCDSAAEPASVSETAPVVETTSATEAFGFTASATDFASNGDSSQVSWFSQSDALKALLTGGEDLQVQGDDKNVVLRGSVDSETMKAQKASDAQAFFGPDVVIDNQLMVKATDVSATAPPPTTKLYFETGKTTLPGDADTSLAPIIDWLKAHTESKAVLSGFHDSRGDQALNEELAKNRAKAVREALKAGGIDESRIEMRKPESVDGGDDLAEARRVEVSVE